MGYPTPEAEACERVERLSGRDDHAVFVAERSGTVIGWMHVFHLDSMEQPPMAVIAGLVVTEAERGSGAGARLVAEGEAWAQARGCRRMRVRSNVIRERAHRFYVRLGYSITKTQRVFDKPSEKVPGATAGTWHFARTR